MRLILLLYAIAAIAWLTQYAHAGDARPAPTFSVTPVTEEFLRKLDNDQLRIVRQAQGRCPRTPIRRERDPCITMSTDKAVAATNDPDLAAFHKALPATERYDEMRSSVTWRAWLIPKN